MKTYSTSGALRFITECVNACSDQVDKADSEAVKGLWSLAMQRALDTRKRILDAMAHAHGLGAPDKEKAPLDGAPDGKDATG